MEGNLWVNEDHLLICHIMVTPFTVININASRIGRKEKVLDVMAFMNAYNPTVVCIQEINIRTVYKYCQEMYQVIGNKEDSQEDIGIVTLIKKGIYIEQNIIAKNGRIIGTKIKGCQIWNINPPSCTNKKQKKRSVLL